MTNDEMLKATSGSDTDWDEERVDIIGQNGNDGLAYEEVQLELPLDDEGC